jgi:hypothetical protein
VILCLEAAGRPALRRKGLALRSWASRGSRPVRGHRGLRLSVGKKTLVRTGPLSTLPLRVIQSVAPRVSLSQTELQPALRPTSTHSSPSVSRPLPQRIPLASLELAAVASSNQTPARQTGVGFVLTRLTICPSSCLPPIHDLSTICSRHQPWRRFRSGSSRRRSV